MKKLIVIASMVFIGFSGFSQSVEKMNNPDINFILVVATSSKCEIFYSNGEGEEVKINTEEAKKLGLDAEERNIAQVTGNLIKNGWQITASNSTSAGANRIFFIRK